MMALWLVFLVAVGCRGMVKGEVEGLESNLRETVEKDLEKRVEVEGIGVEIGGSNGSVVGVVSEKGGVESDGDGRKIEGDFKSRGFVVQSGLRFGTVEDVSRQEIGVERGGNLGLSLKGLGGNNNSDIEVKPRWSYSPLLPLSNDGQNVTRNNRVAEVQEKNEKKSDFLKPQILTNFEPQMERILEPLVQTISQSQRINLELPVSNVSGDFRPSPQLQLPVYEYNRIPVAPAHPEPKSFGKIDIWSTKVKFPKPEVPVTVKDFPYPYASQKNFPVFPTTFQDFDDKKFFRKPDVVHEVIEEERTHTDLSSSPWKKVIKILTAFIPIGLLISALTPSVIHISPMNGTYARARANFPKPIALDLLSQLDQDGCDDRIFCEILLSAEEMKQSKTDATNLLQNYVQGNKVDKRAKILKAVKSKNCDSLRCDGMKKN